MASFTDKELEALRDYWCTPNWTIPRDYGYINTLKSEKPWDFARWEFVRRDDFYRYIWRKQQKGEETGFKSSYFGLEEFIPPNKRGDELSDDFAFIESAYHKGIIARNKGVARAVSLADFMKDPVGISELAVPDEARTGRKVFDLLDKGFLIFVFDPRIPPEYSLNYVGSKLEKHREYLESKGEKIIKRRNIPKDPVTLLRVLDADYEGASDVEIGEKIYNKKTTVNNNAKHSQPARHAGNRGRKRARQYRDNFSRLQDAKLREQ